MDSFFLHNLTSCSKLWACDASSLFFFDAVSDLAFDNNTLMRKAMASDTLVTIGSPLTATRSNIVNNDDYVSQPLCF